MNCPLCVNQALVAHHRGGIEVDICGHCHGIWLDRGELDRFADAPVAVSDGDRARNRSNDSVPKDQKRQKSKKKKKKGLAHRLGDVLEDVLDL